MESSTFQEGGAPDYGDVMEEGDLEIGDASVDEAGDAEFGDAVAALETGAPMSRWQKALIGGALGVGALGTAYGITQRVRAKREGRRKRAAQAIVKSVAARTKDTGYTSRLQAPMPFLGFDNCRVQISPLGDPMRSYPTKLLANALDRTEQDSPATAVVTTIAASGAGVATDSVAAADILVAAMLVPYFIIEFSAPTLNALPAGLITISTLTISSQYLGTLNLLSQGQLVIAVAGVTNRVAVMVTPWNFVNSFPQPTLGVIGSIPIISGGVPVASASAINVVASGLPPSVSFMSIIVPGSSHLVTKRIREFVARGGITGQKTLSNIILGGL